MVFAAWGCDDAPVVAEVDAGQRPCLDDRYGYGDEALPAADLGPGVHLGLVVCDGAPDWFRVDAPVGARVAVAADGASSLRLTDAEGATVGRGGRGVVPPGGLKVGILGQGRYDLYITDQALEDCAGELQLCGGVYTLGVGTGEGTDTVRVGVRHVAGGPAEVSLYWFDTLVDAARLAPGATVEVGARVGQVELRVRPASPEGEVAFEVLAPERADPDPPGPQRYEGAAAVADGTRVDLLDEAGLVVATTTAAGGGYAFDVAHSAEVTPTLRAEVAGAGPLVRVTAPDRPMPRRSPIEAVDPSVRVAELAAAALDPLDLSPSGPPVHYRWAPGLAADCGTCFRPGPEPVIDLSGSAADPDHEDPSVVLHELGHYVAFALGRDDSPGGAHGPERTRPEIAWSEGWADFFAAWAQGDPVLVDTRRGGARTWDVEVMDRPEAVGVVDGQVSEWLVAAVLWDLYDGGEGDDDAVELGDEVLFGALRATSRATGVVTLEVFLDAIACLSGAHYAQVLEITRGRDFPYTPRCP